MSLVFSIKKDKCFIKNLRKRLQELDNTSFDVGYFPQQGTHQPSGMSYSNLFAIHSFGSKSAGIPARPVLDLNFQLWNPISSNTLIKKQLKNYFSNIKNLNAPLKFSTILETIAGSYVQSTRAIFGDSTKLIDNSNFTVSQKGKQSPLVDTGDLRDHLSYTTTFRSNTIVTP